MFYSRKIYTFLVESISNYAFKEEKKITQIATRQKQSPRGTLQNSSSSLDVRNFENLATKKFPFQENKNTLTGPTNCKKTTRYHAHLSLCAKSRKTNDAKSRKWPKTSIWAFFFLFDDFEAKYLPIANFSEKQVLFKLKVIFCTNFRPKSKKKSLESFLRKIIKCLILG